MFHDTHKDSFRLMKGYGETLLSYCTQQSSLPVGGRSGLEPKVEIRTGCIHKDFFYFSSVQ